VLIDLGRNWPRTLILAIAISSSVALSLALISLGYGIRESTQDALDRVDADLYVLPEGLNPLFRDLQKFDQGGSVMAEIAGSPHPPERMSPRLKGSLFISTDASGPLEVLATGVDPGPESEFGQFLISDGSWLGGGDPIRKDFKGGASIGPSDLSRELLLSRSLSERLHIGIGEAIEVGADPSELYGGYIVQGIFVDQLSGTSEEIIVRLGEMQFFRGYLQSDTMTEILLGMKDGGDKAALRDWADTTSFRFKDIVDVHEKEDILEGIYSFTRTIQAFSAITIAVTVTVSIAFASTILMISARQRMKELSVLRAIGRSRIGVFTQIVGEALLLSLFGGVIGIAIGFASMALLNGLSFDAIQDLPPYFKLFSLHPVPIVGAIALSVTIGMVSSLIPAVTSAIRTPVAALRGDP
jgi:ABC-type lipoprotein release transport system permease subunit